VTVHVIAVISIGDIGDSLREAFFMFWETLWALILGFTLSGAVQAFVSKDEMQRVLGDHRPKAVVRASVFGMVSSSCSYAATAMAKSLFQKGADFVSAMVFMFASTNLVVELGVVLVVLMGWQFAVAEFIGGPIMIVLLALTGGFVLRQCGTGCVFDHLLGFNNGAATFNDTISGQATNCVTADPQFSDSMYHVAVSSPAVDWSNPAYVFSPDLDGATRPQEAAPDSGSYER